MPTPRATVRRAVAVDTRRAAGYRRPMRHHRHRTLPVLLALALALAACTSASAQAPDPPDCPPPEALTASITEALGVELRWTPNAAATIVFDPPVTYRPSGTATPTHAPFTAGTWGARHLCLSSNGAAFSAWVSVSVTAADWAAAVTSRLDALAAKVSALEARPVGLAPPTGDCSLAGWTSGTRERITREPTAGEFTNDHVNRSGWLWHYLVRIRRLDCPGWPAPITVRDSTTYQVVDHCALPGASRPDRLPENWRSWAPHSDWAAWADRHPTADRWCWDGNRGRVWFVTGDRAKPHHIEGHGHTEAPPSRSAHPD